MNVDQINACLGRGEIDVPGVLPHVARLAREPVVFRPDFGLDELPCEPGVLLIRGARQFGKSTWLEGEIAATIREHGAGSALYLNGDELIDARDLMRAVRELVPLFAAAATVRRLFIDEITAVKGWERALKRLLDADELAGVLVVTTGSKASDLRRGAERLPGRKGRLARTEYIFTPIPYREFERVGGRRLGADGPELYLLSGGCPVALSALLTDGRLPEHVIAMVRDWVLGEFAASGRARASLLAVLDTLLDRGGSPVGYSRLARESGLANNWS